MQIMESILSRFGSRFAIHFLPRERRVHVSPLGFYYHKPFELIAAVKIGKQVRALPFTERYTPFPEMEQELTLTACTFRGIDRDLNVVATFRFVSPFVPRNEQISTAPFFYIEVEVAPFHEPGTYLTTDEADAERPSTDVTILFGMDGERIVHPSGSSVEWYGSYAYRPYRKVFNPGPRNQGGRSDRTYTANMELATLSGSTQRGEDPGTLELQTRFNARDTAKASFVLATHLSQEVLQARDGQYRFLYNDFFPNREAVIRYARDERPHILELCNAVDSLLSASTFGKTAQDLTAYAFHTYAANTFFVRNTNGRKWFSVWEGNCVFHSTLDVEYNLAWFYLSLWPDLLALELDEWAEYVQDGYLSHDIGFLLEAMGQDYPHPMEVEENTNYLLLMFAYWRRTGDSQLINRHFQLVKRLADFLVKADTSGNGVPDTGTANTVDDASAAVQFSKEQTYLGVKTLCALQAATRMAEAAGENNFTPRWKESIQRIRETLERDAWLGDHYAVCIDKDAAGIVNPWTGKPLSGGKLAGWDAFSLYTTNGLLYLLAYGERPELNLDRMRVDLVHALDASLMEYGCTHTSADLSNIWLSQNMWRDHIGNYLGVDCIDMMDRYWAFIQMENTQGRGGCFIDTYGWNWLHMYPRGITCIGLFSSAAGMTYDCTARKLTFAPVRVPLRVPIAALADWSKGAIPWVTFRLSAGQVKMEFENERLLDGMSVTLNATAAEKPQA